MWAGLGRVMLYVFSALGVADIFGLGGDENPSKSLWSNPLVIIGLLLTLILVLNNLSKLQLINK